MAGYGSEMNGARLEFVLRPIPGTVLRGHYTFDDEKKQNVFIEAHEEAGFMLFLPDGHSYRLTKADVVRRGFNRSPDILNFEKKAQDQKSPAGRFRLAITEVEKKKAYTEMEDEVISVCRKFAGPIPNLVHEYDPKGKVAA
jgi:hypothetical protein